MYDLRSAFPLILPETPNSGLFWAFTPLPSCVMLRLRSDVMDKDL
jgi:hypothetical protein